MIKRKSSHGATYRSLLLLAYLSEKPHSITELRERLMNDLGSDYNRVTIQEDLTRLKDYGLSLEVEKKRRVLTSSAFPIKLPDATLNSVKLACKLLNDIGLKSHAAALNGITSIVHDSQKKFLEKSTAFSISPQNLIDLRAHSVNIEKLESAICSLQEVEFLYSSKRSNKPSLHQVQPISLDCKEGKLYLLCFNYNKYKNQLLDFRVDRICNQVKILPIKFSPMKPMTHSISFRIWGNVAKEYQPSFYYERLPIKDPCDRHQDALLIKAEVTDYFWAKQRLLKYLPFVQVTGPDCLVQEFREISSEMTKLYLE